MRGFIFMRGQIFRLDSFNLNTDAHDIKLYRAIGEL